MSFCDHWLLQFLLRKDFFLTWFSNLETLCTLSASFRNFVQSHALWRDGSFGKVAWSGIKIRSHLASCKYPQSYSLCYTNLRGHITWSIRLSRNDRNCAKKETQLISKFDSSKLYNLLDILTEIESAVSNPKCTLLLSYVNSSTRVLPILSKLPTSIQDKWATEASGYKKRYCVPYASLSFFVNFIMEMCEIRNDPGLTCAIQVNTNTNPRFKSASTVTSRKPVSSTLKSDYERCHVHNAGNSVNECRGFSARLSHMLIAQNCTMNVKWEIFGKVVMLQRCT